MKSRIHRRASGPLVVQEDGARFAAIDTTLTPELRAEGMAREIVSRVQRLRKDTGLAVSDRIRLQVAGPEALRAIVEQHRQWIAGEVLAREMIVADDLPGGSTGHRPRARRHDRSHCSHTGRLTMAPTAEGDKKFKPMVKKQIAHFEKRLLEERKRVLKELGHYDETFGSTPQGADGDLSSYSFHMADQGTDAMEREKAFLFASQEGRFLWHIDEALRRLYRSPETFGHCHQCGGEIGFDRLDALPHARFCIECKQREEDGKK